MCLKRCLVAIVLATSTIASANSPDDEVVPNELPRAWDIEQIAKGAPPQVPSRVYVLAWAVMEDERPFRVERCLVLRVLDKDDGFGRWHLNHMYRHPHDKVPAWRQSVSHFSYPMGHKYFPGLWVAHYKRFKQKPTNKDIYASFGVEEVDWSFGQPDRFKFVSCAVCEKSWEAAIGEKPTQFFGR